MSKFWKEASSVIIAAKMPFSKYGTAFAVRRVERADDTDKIEKEGLRVPNYNVLALRRSSKNAYLPDSYVFPGGNIDMADSSKEWMDLFHQYGLGKYAFEPLTSVTRKDSKISIFESQKKDELLKSISLRITGIREVFEESGILLCKSVRAHSSSQHSKWASYLSGHEIQKWQKKVQQNANEFISLCRHFKCYPDILSLQEWSNWLTPNDFTKRFNAVFFLVALDQMPTASSNSSEINELKWSTPEELLDAFSKQEILLPPPQFYELSRLITFDSIERLADFAVQRNSTGSELWMPVRVKMYDGEVLLLPGDDMYPNEPVFAPDQIKKVESSILEYRRQSHHLHRIEHTKDYNTSLIISNIKLSETHILPWVAPF